MKEYKDPNLQEVTTTSAEDKSNHDTINKVQQSEPGDLPPKPEFPIRYFSVMLTEVGIRTAVFAHSWSIDEATGAAQFYFITLEAHGSEWHATSRIIRAIRGWEDIEEVVEATKSVN